MMECAKLKKHTYFLHTVFMSTFEIVQVFFLHREGML